ncbi:MAG: S-layer homology domain-containing protein [Bifidobacteriaceae bacterium]|jgi:hypothetical protein|nr:S-layer homology domain-containing protein [Bifidobacteriaceae bacterium]
MENKNVKLREFSKKATSLFITMTLVLSGVVAISGSAMVANAAGNSGIISGSGNTAIIGPVNGVSLQQNSDGEADKGNFQEIRVHGLRGVIQSSNSSNGYAFAGDKVQFVSTHTWVDSSGLTGGTVGMFVCADSGGSAILSSSTKDAAGNVYTCPSIGTDQSVLIENKYGFFHSNGLKNNSDKDKTLDVVTGLDDEGKPITTKITLSNTVMSGNTVWASNVELPSNLTTARTYHVYAMHQLKDEAKKTIQTNHISITVYPKPSVSINGWRNNPAASSTDNYAEATASITCNLQGIPGLSCKASAHGSTPVGITTSPASPTTSVTFSGTPKSIGKFDFEVRFQLVSTGDVKLDWSYMQNGSWTVTPGNIAEVYLKPSSNSIERNVSTGDEKRDLDILGFDTSGNEISVLSSTANTMTNKDRLYTVEYCGESQDCNNGTTPETTTSRIGNVTTISNEKDMHVVSSAGEDTLVVPAGIKTGYRKVTLQFTNGNSACNFPNPTGCNTHAPAVIINVLGAPIFYKPGTDGTCSTFGNKITGTDTVKVKDTTINAEYTETLLCVDANPKLVGSSNALPLTYEASTENLGDFGRPFALDVSGNIQFVQTATSPQKVGTYQWNDFKATSSIGVSDPISIKVKAIQGGTESIEIKRENAAEENMQDYAECTPVCHIDSITRSTEGNVNVEAKFSLYELDTFANQKISHASIVPIVRKCSAVSVSSESACEGASDLVTVAAVKNGNNYTGGINLTVKGQAKTGLYRIKVTMRNVANADIYAYYYIFIRGDIIQSTVTNADSGTNKLIGTQATTFTKEIEFDAYPPVSTYNHVSATLPTSSTNAPYTFAKKENSENTWIFTFTPDAAGLYTFERSAVTGGSNPNTLTSTIKVTVEQGAVSKIKPLFTSTTTLADYAEGNVTGKLINRSAQISDGTKKVGLQIDGYADTNQQKQIVSDGKVIGGSLWATESNTSVTIGRCRPSTCADNSIETIQMVKGVKNDSGLILTYVNEKPVLEIPAFTKTGLRKITLTSNGLQAEMYLYVGGDPVLYIGSGYEQSTHYDKFPSKMLAKQSASDTDDAITASFTSIIGVASTHKIYVDAYPHLTKTDDNGNINYTVDVANPISVPLFNDPYSIDSDGNIQLITSATAPTKVGTYKWDDFYVTKTGSAGQSVLIKVRLNVLQGDTKSISVVAPLATLDYNYPCIVQNTETTCEFNTFTRSATATSQSLPFNIYKEDAAGNKTLITPNKTDGVSFAVSYCAEINESTCTTDELTMEFKGESAQKHTMTLQGREVKTGLKRIHVEYTESGVVFEKDYYLFIKGAPVYRVLENNVATGNVITEHTTNAAQAVSKTISFAIDAYPEITSFSSSRQGASPVTASPNLEFAQDGNNSHKLSVTFTPDCLGNYSWVLTATNLLSAGISSKLAVALEVYAGDVDNIKTTLTSPTSQLTDYTADGISGKLINRSAQFTDGTKKVALQIDGYADTSQQKQIVSDSKTIGGSAWATETNTSVTIGRCRPSTCADNSIETIQMVKGVKNDSGLTLTYVNEKPVLEIPAFTKTGLRKLTITANDKTDIVYLYIGGDPVLYTGSGYEQSTHYDKFPSKMLAKQSASDTDETITASFTSIIGVASTHKIYVDAYPHLTKTDDNGNIIYTADTANPISVPPFNDSYSIDADGNIQLVTSATAPTKVGTYKWDDFYVTKTGSVGQSVLIKVRLNVIQGDTKGISAVAPNATLDHNYPCIVDSLPTTCSYNTFTRSATATSQLLPFNIYKEDIAGNKTLITPSIYDGVSFDVYTCSETDTSKCDKDKEGAMHFIGVDSSKHTMTLDGKETKTGLKKIVVSYVENGSSFTVNYFLFIKGAPVYRLLENNVAAGNVITEHATSAQQSVQKTIQFLIDAYPAVNSFSSTRAGTSPTDNPDLEFIQDATNPHKVYATFTPTIKGNYRWEIASANALNPGASNKLNVELDVVEGDLVGLDITFTGANVKPYSGNDGSAFQGQQVAREATSLETVEVGFKVDGFGAGETKIIEDGRYLDGDQNPQNDVKLYTESIDIYKCDIVNENGKWDCSTTHSTNITVQYNTNTYNPELLSYSKVIIPAYTKTGLYKIVFDSRSNMNPASGYDVKSAYLLITGAPVLYSDSDMNSRILSNATLNFASTSGAANNLPTDNRTIYVDAYPNLKAIGTETISYKEGSKPENFYSPFKLDDNGNIILVTTASNPKMVGMYNWTEVTANNGATSTSVNVTLSVTQGSTKSINAVAPNASLDSNYPCIVNNLPTTCSYNTFTRSTGILSQTLPFNIYREDAAGNKTLITPSIYDGVSFVVYTCSETDTSKCDTEEAMMSFKGDGAQKHTMTLQGREVKTGLKKIVVSYVENGSSFTVNYFLFIKGAPVYRLLENNIITSDVITEHTTNAIQAVSKTISFTIDAYPEITSFSSSRQGASPVTQTPNLEFTRDTSNQNLYKVSATFTPDKIGNYSWELASTNSLSAGTSSKLTAKLGVTVGNVSALKITFTGSNAKNFSILDDSGITGQQVTREAINTNAVEVGFKVDGFQGSTQLISDGRYLDSDQDPQNDVKLFNSGSFGITIHRCNYTDVQNVSSWNKDDCSNGIFDYDAGNTSDAEKIRVNYNTSTYNSELGSYSKVIIPAYAKTGLYRITFDARNANNPTTIQSIQVAYLLITGAPVMYSDADKTLRYTSSNKQVSFTSVAGAANNLPTDNRTIYVDAYPNLKAMGTETISYTPADMPESFYAPFELDDNGNIILVTTASTPKKVGQYKWTSIKANNGAPSMLLDVTLRVTQGSTKKISASTPSVNNFQTYTCIDPLNSSVTSCPTINTIIRNYNNSNKQQLVFKVLKEDAQGNSVDVATNGYDKLTYTAYSCATLYPGTDAGNCMTKDDTLTFDGNIMQYMGKETKTGLRRIQIDLEAVETLESLTKATINYYVFIQGAPVLLQDGKPVTSSAYTLKQGQLTDIDVVFDAYPAVTIDANSAKEIIGTVKTLDNQEFFGFATSKNTQTIKVNPLTIGQHKWNLITYNQIQTGIAYDFTINVIKGDPSNLNINLTTEGGDALSTYSGEGNSAFSGKLVHRDALSGGTTQKVALKVNAKNAEGVQIVENGKFITSDYVFPESNNINVEIANCDTHQKGRQACLEGSTNDKYRGVGADGQAAKSDGVYLENGLIHVSPQAKTGLRKITIVDIDNNALFFDFIYLMIGGEPVLYSDASKSTPVTSGITFTSTVNTNTTHKIYVDAYPKMASGLLPKQTSTANPNVLAGGDTPMLRVDSDGNITFTTTKKVGNTTAYPSTLGDYKWIYPNDVTADKQTTVTVTLSADTIDKVKLRYVNTANVYEMGITSDLNETENLSGIIATRSAINGEYKNISLTLSGIDDLGNVVQENKKLLDANPTSIIVEKCEQNASYEVINCENIPENNLLTTSGNFRTISLTTQTRTGLYRIKALVCPSGKVCANVANPEAPLTDEMYVLVQGAPILRDNNGNVITSLDLKTVVGGEFNGRDYKINQVDATLEYDNIKQDAIRIDAYPKVVSNSAIKQTTSGDAVPSNFLSINAEKQHLQIKSTNNTFSNKGVYGYGVYLTNGMGESDELLINTKVQQLIMPTIKVIFNDGNKVEATSQTPEPTATYRIDVTDIYGQKTTNYTSPHLRSYGVIDDGDGGYSYQNGGESDSLITIKTSETTEEEAIKFTSGMGKKLVQVSSRVTTAKAPDNTQSLYTDSIGVSSATEFEVYRRPTVEPTSENPTPYEVTGYVNEYLEFAPTYTSYPPMIGSMYIDTLVCENLPVGLEIPVGTVRISGTPKYATKDTKVECKATNHAYGWEDYSEFTLNFTISQTEEFRGINAVGNTSNLVDENGNRLPLTTASVGEKIYLTANMLDGFGQKIDLDDMQITSSLAADEINIVEYEGQKAVEVTLASQGVRAIYFAYSQISGYVDLNAYQVPTFTGDETTRTYELNVKVGERIEQQLPISAYPLEIKTSCSDMPATLEVSSAGVLTGHVTEEKTYSLQCVLSNIVGFGEMFKIVITASPLGEFTSIPSDKIPNQLELDKQYCIELLIITRDMDGNIVDPGQVNLFSTIDFDAFTPVTECKKASANAETMLLTNALNENDEQLELMPMSEVTDDISAFTQATDSSAEYVAQSFVTALHKKTGYRDFMASISEADTQYIATVEGVKRPIAQNFAKTVTKGAKLNETLSVTAHPANVTYACKNLPAGVTITNSKITGSIGKAGAYKATCTPTNSVGAGNTFTITLTVTDVVKSTLKIPITKENGLIFQILDIKGNVHTEGIGYSYKHSITKGCSFSQKGKLVTTKYCPSNVVNRGSMAELMWNLMGQPKVTSSVPAIKDIGKLSKNRQTAIKWLASEGITVLNDEHQFNPQNPVNRGAMAEFLYKLTGSPAYTPTKSELSKFKDVGKLTAPRKKAIAWLAKTGITTGVTKTTYVPNRAVNRGSMATFFMRLIQKFGGK